jgi:hypothetical protein
VNVFVIDHRHLRPPFRQPVEARPAHHAQEPRSPVTASEAAEVPRSAIVRLLDNVLGGVLVPSQPTRQVVRRIEVRECGLFELPPLIGFQIIDLFSARRSTFVESPSPYPTHGRAGLFPKPIFLQEEYIVGMAGMKARGPLQIAIEAGFNQP